MAEGTDTPLLSYPPLTPKADTESHVQRQKAWQTLLAAPSHVDQLMTVAAGGASVSARVAVILETSAGVYQHRVTVTKLFFNVFRLQQQHTK